MRLSSVTITTFFAFLLLEANANAYQLGWVGFNQARTFLAKTRSCKLAIVQASKHSKADQNRLREVANFYGVPKSDEPLMSMFWCLGDFTINANTAIEKNGCALVIYDVNQASVLQNLAFSDGKSCDAGGAEEIVKAQVKNKLNEFACGTGENPFGGPTIRRRLVYAESDHYKQMWITPAEKCQNPFAKDAQAVEPEEKQAAASPAPSEDKPGQSWNPLKALGFWK